MPRRVAVFLSLCVLFCGTTVLWLWLDRTPPRWDDGSYLTKSLKVYDTLTEDGVVGYVRRFLVEPDFRAPLIAFLPAPIYLLAGRSPEAAFVVNIASMIILFGAVYAIGTWLRSPRAGILAVTIVGTMPLIYGLSRWFMVEYTLTAIVALAHLLLIYAVTTENNIAPVLFGLLSGFGLLLKVSYPLFVLPAFIYALVRSQRRTRFLLVSAIPCAIIAMPWYVYHYRPVFLNAIEAGYGYSATVQGTGAILSWGAIETYLRSVVVSGTSVYYAGLAGLVCISLFFRSVRAESTKGSTWFLLWMLPFTVFLFGGNKDVRYIAPILPAFGVALSMGLDRVIPQRTWGRAFMCLVTLFPLAAMFFVSFNESAPTTLRGAYSRPYSRVEWPQRAILNDISGSGEGNLVLIGSDLDVFNINNFELVAVNERLPLNFATTAYEKDRDAALRAMDHADFIVLRQGGQPESKFFNVHVNALQEHVETADRFSALHSYPLPDGGRATVYKSLVHDGLVSSSFLRNRHASEDEFVVAFGDMFQLAALSAADSGGVLRLRLRWRCLKSPDRDYWSFVHVINRSGATIGNLDHPIVGGVPPTSDWRPGDVAIEDLQFQLPAGEARPALKVGIYHVKSGERLSIGPLDTIAANRFTKTDQNTALLAR